MQRRTGAGPPQVGRPPRGPAGYRAPVLPPGSIVLANNEVPDGPPPGVLEAIGAAARTANRYPSPHADALVERLAERLGVPPEHLVVGCGSVDVLGRALRVVCRPGDEVAFAWRSFDLYPDLVDAADATGRPVDLGPGGVLDLAALAGAVGDRTRVVLLCNPNNPTSTAVEEADLVDFLGRVPSDVLVLLDETYRDFSANPRLPDGVRLAGAFPNVAVLRTFSKAYGLAGLRVGYAVLPAHVASAVRRAGPPYAVNAVAEAAAVAALDAHGEVAERCRRTIAERDRVRAGLVLLGYRPARSEANFVWLPLGPGSAAFTRHCRRDGIVVRCYDGEGVRVTVGSRAENDHFLATAAKFEPGSGAPARAGGDQPWATT
ncbi:histidinol-phosphate transaminase [Actinosynnema sp. NPDC050436]|uniref:histidinol-phosphate transaminase n=1 Tax=Actinosynnema sp. NPDC050436 TaxID=3155659 RepID=UPI0033EF1A26